MALRWDEARARSLRHWRWIVERIGSSDPMTIVDELNELGGLCEMAVEQAGGEEGHCRHCVVFGDARQCVDTRLDISALVLAGETDKARAATMAVFERIFAASPPGLD